MTVEVENYSGGEQGSVGIVTSWKPETGGDPNAVMAPTQWTLAETDTLDSVPAHIERNVYAESRDADKGHRTGKYDVGGQIGGGLYPTNMIEAEIAAIGTDAFTAAPGTADTTTSVTTAGNVSTIVLSGTPASYAPPDLVTVDTGAVQECRPVLSYDAGTKTLVVPALFLTHGATISVEKLPQILTQPYSKVSGFSKFLRRLCVEEHVGDQEAYAYPNAQVGKYSIKATSSKFDVTMDLVCGAQRVELGSPTAYDDTDPSLDDLGFEFTDGFMVFPDDPTDTGTPTLQLVSDGQDWGLDLDNGMKKVGNNDGTETYKYVPGLRKIQITFKKLTQSSYPVIWKKFLTKNLDAQWFAFMCLNIGTDTVPVWQAKCYYCPNVRYITAKPIKGLNDVIGEDVTGIAREANGQAKIYVSASDPAITAAL